MGESGQQVPFLESSGPGGGLQGEEFSSKALPCSPMDHTLHHTKCTPSENNERTFIDHYYIVCRALKPKNAMKWYVFTFLFLHGRHRQSTASSSSPAPPPCPETPVDLKITMTTQLQGCQITMTTRHQAVIMTTKSPGGQTTKSTQ